ncbi:hypothetical protein RFI_06337 [Reticulomyxa filosa]|uniref:Guanylate cyclase domain-containing protein n=1 Tax=Reticulomyxa filosa TaxID=46433 RepID=X6NZQ7_RETFI|nr:hypothetical protein RFI_06337 [Reticulomyxa filosa]|eukprot:ETO30782.1 hypothetical protein RFI_06337 [Reticulomyxa filosa]
MESTSEPGKIHLSEEFYNNLHPLLQLFCEKLEPIAVKGKGMMTTYYLHKIQFDQNYTPIVPFRLSSQQQLPQAHIGSSSTTEHVVTVVDKPLHSSANVSAAAGESTGSTLAPHTVPPKDVVPQHPAQLTPDSIISPTLVDALAAAVEGGKASIRVNPMNWSPRVRQSTGRRASISSDPHEKITTAGAKELESIQSTQAIAAAAIKSLHLSLPRRNSQELHDYKEHEKEEEEKEEERKKKRGMENKDGVMTHEKAISDTVRKRVIGSDRDSKSKEIKQMIEHIVSDIRTPIVSRRASRVSDLEGLHEGGLMSLITGNESNEEEEKEWNDGVHVSVKSAYVFINTSMSPSDETYTFPKEQKEIHSETRKRKGSLAKQLLPHLKDLTVVTTGVGIHHSKRQLESQLSIHQGKKFATRPSSPFSPSSASSHSSLSSHSTSPIAHTSETILVTNVSSLPHRDIPLSQAFDIATNLSATSSFRRTKHKHSNQSAMPSAVPPPPPLSFSSSFYDADTDKESNPTGNESALVFKTPRGRVVAHKFLFESHSPRGAASQAKYNRNALTLRSAFAPKVTKEWQRAEKVE